MPPTLDPTVVSTPHVWGAKLANVAIRIAKRLPKHADNRAIAKQLSN
jgi:hypothetical protein